jgi:hypothetical protein
MLYQSLVEKKNKRRKEKEKKKKKKRGNCQKRIGSAGYK